MADGFDNLGKASLDLTANVVDFDRNIAAAGKTAGGLENKLEALAAISEIAEHALQKVKMKPGQAAETEASAQGILAGVRGISDEARDAARELDRVKLSEVQAEETQVAGNRIERMLNGITRHANEARRSLESVRIVGGVPGRSGVGVGPFGSGFGRVGVLGAAIGAGTLLAPAAGPGAAGLLAAVPTLAFGAAGALGTLVLAFKGVGKAIDGDKKAFDDLGPSAQKFVLTIRSLDGWFDKLKETAAGSLFPGLTTGLKAALSPGTTTAITTGVQQFGHAIGEAGAQWGRYFGSAKFQQLLGPLMQAGAQNFLRLSNAMLSLFDALSVLGRAAIPFTAWITRGIADGSRFASTWLRAKEATGGLARTMEEAKVSLRLVGGLGLALLRVVGALGKALYPVAKVAVKALTDGLNALARIIQRNQQTIREIVGGALAALISTVKIAAPIVGALARALGRVVHAVGGWKTAFEIVLSGYLASKFIGLASGVGKARSEMGLLRGAMLALGSPEVLAAIAAVGAAYAIYKGLTADEPTVVGRTAVGTKVVQSSNGHLYVSSGYGRGLTPLRPGTKFKPIYTSAVATGADRSNHPGLNPVHSGGAPKRKQKVDTTDPFGKPPPFTKNVPAPAHAHLKRVAKALQDHRGAELQFAVDEARDAVAAAKVGSSAYDRAIKAEEKALRAQIAYLDKRAHNSKLSLDAREKAIRVETADRKKLAALLKPVTHSSAATINAGANEAQFLASIKMIYGSFASNAQPASGKTDTHLYEMKHELRQQTGILTDIHRGGRFPSSAYASESALAVTG